MKLKLYLRIKNIKHSKFAQMIGLSRNYMESVISEKKRPGTILADKIVSATDGYVSLDELLFPSRYEDIQPEEILRLVTERKPKNNKK